MIFWGKLQKPIRKTRRVMAKPEKGMDSWAEQDGMEFMMPFPLHFHWLVDDLHICAGPSVNGQLWCLNVDVRRLSTGQCERMLWDANTPWGLVRRDSHSSSIMSVLPGPRERDLLIVAGQIGRASGGERGGR